MVGKDGTWCPCNVTLKLSKPDKIRRDVVLPPLKFRKRGTLYSKSFLQRFATRWYSLPVAAHALTFVLAKQEDSR